MRLEHLSNQDDLSHLWSRSSCFWQSLLQEISPEKPIKPPKNKKQRPVFNHEHHDCRCRRTLTPQELADREADRRDLDERLRQLEDRIDDAENHPRDPPLFRDEDDRPGLLDIGQTIEQVNTVLQKISSADYKIKQVTQCRFCHKKYIDGKPYCECYSRFICPLCNESVYDPNNPNVRLTCSSGHSWYQNPETLEKKCIEGVKRFFVRPIKLA